MNSDDVLILFTLLLLGGLGLAAVISRPFTEIEDDVSKSVDNARLQGRGRTGRDAHFAHG